MNNRPLNDALKAGGGLRVIGAIRDQILELGLQIIDKARAQLVQIHAAGAHYGGSIRVVDQRQQEMLQRRILVVTFVCNRQRAVQGLFKALRKSRHSRPLWPPPS